MCIHLRQKRRLSLRLSERKNECLSLSLSTIRKVSGLSTVTRRKTNISPSPIDMHIKQKPDYRTIPFSYLFVFINHYLLEIRIVTNGGGEDHHQVWFYCLIDCGSNKLHSTSGDTSEYGSQDRCLIFTYET